MFCILSTQANQETASFSVDLQSTKLSKNSKMYIQFNMVSLTRRSPFVAHLYPTSREQYDRYCLSASDSNEIDSVFPSSLRYSGYKLILRNVDNLDKYIVHWLKVESLKK